MKFLIRFFQLLVVVVLTSCASSSYKIQKFDQSQLKNGLKVSYFKDQKLPYFTVYLVLPSGYASDSEKSPGAAVAVAELLAKGTKNKTATEIAQFWDQRGAWFKVSVDADYTMISAGGLSRHQDEILNMFSELMLKPVFKPAEINRYKKQARAQLLKALDSPSSLASIASKRILFAGHPYGNLSSGGLKGLKNLKKKYINRHYIKFYHPSGAHLAIVGNYNEQAASQVEKYFGAWVGRRSPSLKFNALSPIKGLNYHIVHKPGLKQTEVRFTHFGIKKASPDFINLQLANSVLGSGGLSSRLMDEIRNKRGLTYGIYTGFRTKKVAGEFILSTSSRHEKAREIISESLKQIEKFKSEGVTQKELNEAQKTMRADLPLILETPEKLANNILVLEMFGLSRKYLDNYLSNVDKASVGDVNKVIKKYFHPENMHIVVFTDLNKTRSLFKDVKYKKLNYRNIVK